MSSGRRRAILIGALAAAAVLRYDFWQWDDPTRLLGLPVGLTYHVGFCLVVSLLMAGVVRAEWPEGGAGGEDR